VQNEPGCRRPASGSALAGAFYDDSAACAGELITIQLPERRRLCFELICRRVAGTMLRGLTGTAVMNTYETTATVDAHGQVRLAGVPFEAGTEVEISISPKRQSQDESVADDQACAAARQRMDGLIAALDKARNTERVGSLNREELYDRDVLR
jgi:hypothetical protein